MNTFHPSKCRIRNTDVHYGGLCINKGYGHWSELKYEQDVVEYECFQIKTQKPETFGVPQGPWWMAGAQPQRMTVISPAIGPVWAVLPMAPSLPIAALRRPWWPLLTRQATAWRALASAREVGVWGPASHCWTGTCTNGRWFVLFCSNWSSCHPLADVPLTTLACDFLSLYCFWMLSPGCAWGLLYMAGPPVSPCPLL